MNYDVFIDESGLFIEASTDPTEQAKHRKQKRKFASQLAGIVCHSGKLTGEWARKTIEKSLNSAGIAAEHQFHSKNARKRSKSGFDRFVELLTGELLEAKLQPVRIVNTERVSFGNRVANYTNILAELLVRICEQLDATAGDEPIVLKVITAKVRDDEDERGVFEIIMGRDDYLARIRERFAIAAITHGWGEQTSKWSIDDVVVASGKDDPRLWIADAVSNASHDDFQTISKEASDALEGGLGEYNFSLSFNTTLQQVRELRDRDAYGTALVQLLEGLFSPWISTEAKAAYTGEFDRMVEGMLALPSSARSLQLQTVMGWLHQTADDRSRLAEAKSLCKWIEERFVSKHEESIHSHDATLAAWLRLGISTAWLTACNHSGDLVEGRKRFESIDALIPEIAGRWEYASDLMRAMVVQSVHLNDCFEHNRVCEKMDLVSMYYETLGSMFRDAYKEVFPATVRSKVCGEALGTKVQSEIFLLLSGDVTVDVVRETSEKAIEQFADEHDRRRQYQFRSEIEAIAGQWQQSREYLAKGIGCPQCDHQSLGNYIAALPEGDRSFPLLHWTRIGGMAAVAQDKAELDSFAVAWRASELDSFIQREMSGYPGHGILRRMASFYASVGDDAKVIETLRSLRSVVKANPTTLFGLIEVAAVLQACGIAGRCDPDLMGRLLGGSKSDPAISELIKKVANDASASQPRIAALASQWAELSSGTPTPDQLVDAASVVAY